MKRPPRSVAEPSSLAAQERLYRDCIRVFTNALANTVMDDQTLDACRVALSAVADLLQLVSREWHDYDDAWNAQHDLLVVGVHLEEPLWADSRGQANYVFREAYRARPRPPKYPQRADKRKGGRVVRSKAPRET